MTNTIIFKQNGQYGLRTIEGAVILAPTYEKIKYLNQDRFTALKNELWAILDSEAKFITGFSYKEVGNFYNDRAVVELNTEFIRKVLIDLSGKELEMEYKEDVIEGNMRYQNIYPTHSSDRYIANFGSMYRMLDKNGKFVAGGQKYKTLKPLNENLFLAKKFGTEVVIDKNHNILFEVPEKYDDIYYQMSNGMYQVTTESGLSGYLDAQGNEVIPAIYYGGYEFSDDADLAFVMIDEEKGGYINSKNEFVIEPIYEFGNVFENGLAGVQKDGQWFFINEKGEKISGEYLEIGHFINGYCKVTLLDGSKVVVDANADVVFSYPEDTEIGYFVNGLAPITQEGKVGLINSAGEIIIEPKYEEIVVSEHSTIHKFKENGFFGYLRETGEVYHEAVLEKADNFGENGSAIVQKDGIAYLLENFGENVSELNVDLDYQMTSSEFGDSDVAAVKVDDDAYVFMDTDGKRVGPVYELTTAFYKGQAFATIPAEYHIIDKNGQVVNTQGYKLSLEDGQLVLEINE